MGSACYDTLADIGEKRSAAATSLLSLLIVWRKFGVWRGKLCTSVGGGDEALLP